MKSKIKKQFIRENQQKSWAKAPKCRMSILANNIKFTYLFTCIYIYIHKIKLINVNNIEIQDTECVYKSKYS